MEIDEQPKNVGASNLDLTEKKAGVRADRL